VCAAALVVAVLDLVIVWSPWPPLLTPSQVLLCPERWLDRTVLVRGQVYLTPPSYPEWIMLHDISSTSAPLLGCYFSFTDRSIQALYNAHRPLYCTDRVVVRGRLVAGSDNSWQLVDCELVEVVRPF
jgi:hypothetical protein